MDNKEDLKAQMEAAYLAGNFEEALRLSQELDKHILVEQKGRMQEWKEKQGNE